MQSARRRLLYIAAANRAAVVEGLSASAIVCCRWRAPTPPPPAQVTDPVDNNQVRDSAKNHTTSSPSRSTTSGHRPQDQELCEQHQVRDPMKNTTSTRSTTSGLGHRLQEDNIRSQTPETAIRSGTLQKVGDAKCVPRPLRITRRKNRNLPQAPKT